MTKIISFLFVSLFFLSCTSTQETQLSPSEKVFEKEDTYIMFALRAEQVKSYKTAVKLFDELYEKSGKKEYLYRAVADRYLLKDYEGIISKVDETLESPLSDRKLVHYKIYSLSALERYDEAEVLAVALAKNTKESDDYILAAEIFSKKDEHEKAVSYLESAYAKEYNEKILDRLAIILYINLSKKKEAIAELETHTRVHGCSELICKRLAGFYSNENNIEGLLSIYKRLYSISPDQEIAEKIIQIYGYKKDYVQLMNFLEDSGQDDELLLQLYVSGKIYDKAQKIADKLYAKEGNLEYLGQSGIYEYESNKDKLNKEILASVVDKLEKVAEGYEEPLYKNYLGYLLIDHDIDVKKGMKYIREVLKVKPDSGYYLDSLAWGYYKLGNCKKAKELITKVQTLEGGDDPEVELHLKKIDECLKKQKLRRKK